MKFFPNFGAWSWEQLHGSQPVLFLIFVKWNEIEGKTAKCTTSGYKLFYEMCLCVCVHSRLGYKLFFIILDKLGQTFSSSLVKLVWLQVRIWPPKLPSLLVKGCLVDHRVSGQDWNAGLPEPHSDSAPTEPYALDKLQAFYEPHCFQSKKRRGLGELLCSLLAKILDLVLFLKPSSVKSELS